MPKRDLSKQFGQRYTTQEVVVVEDPIAAASAAIHQGDESMAGVEPQPPVEEREQGELKSARTHARTHTDKRVSTRTHTPGGIAIETLYEKLQNRKHLSSSTFRYQPDELRELEDIYTLLDEKRPGKLSRNDIARLGLIWLCEDYHRNGDASLLEQVLKRT